MGQGFCFHYVFKSKFFWEQQFGSTASGGYGPGSTHNGGEVIMTAGLLSLPVFYKMF